MVGWPWSRWRVEEVVSLAAWWLAVGPQHLPHNGVPVSVSSALSTRAVPLRGAKGKGPVSVSLLPNTSLPLCNPPPPKALFPLPVARF